MHKLVEERLKPNYENVWVVGSTKFVRDFFKAKLVNEIRQIILPIMLGEGTLFYDQVGVEQALHLKEVNAFKNGMVELWYEVKSE